MIFTINIYNTDENTFLYYNFYVYTLYEDTMSKNLLCMIYDKRVYVRVVFFTIPALSRHPPHFLNAYWLDQCITSITIVTMDMRSEHTLCTIANALRARI